MINELLYKDKYLYLYNEKFQAVSIFDHIRYDRSDYDMLSPPQRKYLLKLLLDNSGRQITGRKVAFEDGTTITFPRANAMSPSPGDVLEELSQDEGHFLVLTPTQLAYALIKELHDEPELLMSELNKLITAQPINLYKVQDYAESEGMKSFLRKNLESLKAAQETITTSEPMKNRRHLGAIC